MPRLFPVALLLLLWSMWAQGQTVSHEEIQKDASFLRSLGLRVPAQGLLLDEPFAGPVNPRSYLVPVDWIAARPQVSTPRKMRADLPVLKTAMEKVYGGWERAEKFGWNWPKFFQDWDRYLAAMNQDAETTGDRLIAPFINEFQAFQTDNHTSFELSSSIQNLIEHGSAATLLNDSPVGTCTKLINRKGEAYSLNPKDPSHRPKPVQVFDPSSRSMKSRFYISHPQALGDIARIECDGGHVPTTPVWGPKFNAPEMDERKRFILELASPGHTDLRDVMAPAYRTLEQGIAYLRVPRLSGKVRDQLMQLEKTLPPEAGREKVLIVDLRFDEGGHDHAYFTFIGFAKRWPELHRTLKVNHGNFSRWEKSSCLTGALTWNGDRSGLSKRSSLKDDELKAAQALLDSLFKSSDPACSVTVKKMHSELEYRQRKFAPKSGETIFLVLTDNACGSDCESLTYSLAASKQALIAGQNTFGVAQYIIPTYGALPETRFVFRMAKGMSDLYGDGRSVDGFGLDVDLLLPDKASQSGAGILSIARFLKTKHRE